MTTDPPVQEWPSVTDVAGQLGLTVQHAYWLLHRGRLTGVKTRVGWLLAPSSVATFEASRGSKPVRRQKEPTAC